VETLSRESGEKIPVLPMWLRGTREVAPPGFWVPRFAAVTLRVGAPLKGTVTPTSLREALREATP
jgi:1-acyl-sn-glycerol-3-phosphate acyltransferase